MTCQELVELVTEYLDDALPAVERARFDDHIRDCDLCQRYLQQMRVAIDLLGRLTPEDVDPAVERTLVDAFHGWKTAKGTPPR